MALRFSSKLAAICALAGLVACGGGGGTATVPSTPSGGHSMGSTTMSFFIPFATTSASRKRGQALPASTQSLLIAVASATGTPLNPPVPPTIVNVSGSNCTTVGSGLSCTANVVVPLGNLAFAVIAYAGANATGAAIAEGGTNATIGTGTNTVSITMSAANVYAGSTASGGVGFITIDHSANTFAVVGQNGKTTTGTIASLPNGDLKLVVSATSDTTAIGDIVYGRELAGSVFIFADTGSTTVIPNGSVQGSQTGGDLGAGVALQGCPTASSAPAATVADSAGPAWNTAPTTSAAYTSGTVTFSVTGGTATYSFSGSNYTSSGATGSAQSGTGTCSGGIFSSTNQSSIAYSPDGILVVGNSSGGNISPGDITEGGFGFVPPPATINTAALVAGTYDGFIGGLSLSGPSTIVKSETPFNVTGSGSTLTACGYSNFEAGTIGTTCATLTLGAQTQQPGVILATANVPGQGTSSGAIVVGQTSGGKFVIFGNVGGSNVFLLQH